MRSGTRHTGGLNLERAVVGNGGTLVSMLTEKLQVGTSEVSTRISWHRMQQALQNSGTLT
jgi:hypothetical protein